MAWTENTILRLRVLWHQGLSCSQVADKLNLQFGTSFTRNSVIGKIHRLGDELSRVARVSAVYEPEEKTKVPRPKRTQMKRKRPKWNPEAAELESTAQPYVESTPMSDLEIPLEQRKTLMELTSGDCRWPVGDPCTADFFFCGGQRKNGLPYCAGHCARGFNGAPQRTRSKAAIEMQRRAMLRRFGKTEGSWQILDANP